MGRKFFTFERKKQKPNLRNILARIFFSTFNIYQLVSKTVGKTILNGTLSKDFAKIAINTGDIVEEVKVKILKQDLVKIKLTLWHCVKKWWEASIFLEFFKVLQFLLFSGNILGTVL